VTERSHGWPYAETWYSYGPFGRRVMKDVNPDPNGYNGGPGFTGGTWEYYFYGVTGVHASGKVALPVRIRLLFQRQAGILEGAPAAIEGDRVGVAHFLEIVGYQGGAETAATI
jgi:hypothetical protein